MIKKIQKNVKGITLIALVVTIIILLILAGVAISLTIGQNGIISRAQEATIIHENASVYEQLQFVVLDYQMSDVENSTETEILSKLKEDGYVNEDNTLNIERLMGRRLNTGRGNLEDGDVYVLEQREETASSTMSDTSGSLKYFLIYYNDEMAETNMGIAFEVSDGGIYEPTDPSLFFADEEGGISLARYNTYYSDQEEWTIEDVVLPEEVDGKEVKVIRQSLFRAGYPGNSYVVTSDTIANNLKSVVIPDTVVEIQDHAFAFCKSLESIRLSSNIEIIGKKVFSNCESLTEIEIPDSITEIGTNAFEYCNNLTKIYINKPLEEIGGNENAPWGATNAEIIYKPYEDFKESYLENKSQSELEDIFILGYGEYPTFDEYLEGEGLTREQIQEQALEEGLTYEEVFKMAISEDCDGWVQVEFEFEESEFSNKSDDELKAYLIEGTEYSTFDQALQAITSDETMNEGKFVQMVQETALRNERNFFKILVVEKMTT